MKGFAAQTSTNGAQTKALGFDPKFKMGGASDMDLYKYLFC